MNKHDKEYIELIKKVAATGRYIDDRTGAGRLNLVSSSMVFDMREGFPLLQCKKTPFKMVVKELLWFISGETNIKPLVDQGVKIWIDDAYNYYLRLFNDYELSMDQEPLTKEHFIDNLGHEWGLSNYRYGDLGNVYGLYWAEQLPDVIENIKNDPFSARHRVDCWRPDEQSDLECALNPCHYGFQFVCEGDDDISMVFNMRSTDAYLG